MANDAEKLGLPEAPAAPVLELPQPAAEAGLPEAPPAFEQERRAPRAEQEPPRRMHRVGTGTMGVLLILVGLALCVGLFRPSVDFTLLLRLSPLALVALGVEILIAARKKDVRLKYDWGSIILCFLLVVGVLGVSCLTQLYAYEGPPRNMAQYAIAQELSDATFARLKGNAQVQEVDYQVYLSLAPGRPASDVQTIADLTAADQVYVQAELSGSCADEAAFAAACRPVIEAVLAAGAPHPRININTAAPSGSTQPIYSLSIDGPYQLAMDEAGLAALVEKSVYVENAGTYMTPEEKRRWEEDEQDNARQDELTELYRTIEETEGRAMDAEERASAAEARAAELEEALENTSAALEEAERQLVETYNE